MPFASALLLVACTGDPPPPDHVDPAKGSAEYVVRSAPNSMAPWDKDWRVQVLARDATDPGAAALARGLGVSVGTWSGQRPALRPGEVAALWVPADADLAALSGALRPSGQKAPMEGEGALVLVLGGGSEAWRSRALKELPWLDAGLLDPERSAALWMAQPALSPEARGAVAADALAEAFPGLRAVPTTLEGLPPGLAQHLGAPASPADPDPRVRAEAARLSPESVAGDAQVAVRLAAAPLRPEAFAADPEPLVRARVADAARDPALLARLSQDPSSVVRVIATHSLARLAAGGSRDPVLVQALLQAAKGSDAYQRWKAAYGLSYLPEGRDTLVALLANDIDIDVRREAAHALSRHRGPEVRAALLTALGDSNSFVRRWAAYGLGNIEDPSVVEALRGATKDPTALVAGEAVLALQRYGVREPMVDYRGLAEPPDLAAAEKLAANPDATLRKDLCKVLVGMPDATRLLLHLARDADSEVRKAAVEALGWIEDPAIDLSSAVRDPDPDTIVAALEAVRQGRRAAMDAVGPRLQDPDTEIRLRAAEALAAMAGRGVEGAAEALLGALDDADERVRAAAISVHPDRLDPAEPAVLVRRAAALAGTPAGEDALAAWALPGADPDRAAWAAGVLTREDELLHLRFSWNRPEDQPASHRALRPPLIRPYGHPNRG